MLEVSILILVAMLPVAIMFYIILGEQNENN